MLATWNESANAGDGWWEPTKLPEITPNFLYGLLAPVWAEQNQLVRTDYQLAARLASALQENLLYNEDQTAYTVLVDRTIDTPLRGARLRKMLIDCVNGLPDGDERSSLFNSLAAEEVGHQVQMRPTTELINDLFRHAYGWGPLEELMEDQTITEIMVDRHDLVFVERTTEQGAQLVRESRHFESPLVLRRFVERMVEQTKDKSINFRNPTVDMSLPDGSRVNTTIPPITRWPTITIRRKRERFYNLDELQAKGSFDPVVHEFLHEANLAGVNLMTYGPTGSGKTTLLTALLDDKPIQKRLVICEDTAEINIEIERHPNTIWMLANDHRDIRALVRNALRMRPDHLIVGETRDATAYDLIQAFNTGQSGSMSTLHARDPESALVRLTNLVRMAEGSPSEEPARRMVSDAIQLLIFAARLPDGTRRLMSIDEVMDIGENFNFRHQNIFRLQQSGRDERGMIRASWILNPDYVMGPTMAKLFVDSDYDPQRWTGEAARAAGKHPNLAMVA